MTKKKCAKLKKMWKMRETRKRTCAKPGRTRGEISAVTRFKCGLYIQYIYILNIYVYVPTTVSKLGQAVNTTKSIHSYIAQGDSAAPPGSSGQVGAQRVMCPRIFYGERRGDAYVRVKPPAESAWPWLLLERGRFKDGKKTATG